MTPAQLSDLIRASIQAAAQAGELQVAVPPAVEIRRAAHDPRQWSTSAAMRLPDARGPVALATRLRRDPRVADVEIAGPGFLNITVDAAELAQVARMIVLSHREYLVRDHARSRTSEALGDVEFAHGRACSVITQAAAHGVTRDGFDPATLDDATDMALLMALAEAHDEPGPQHLRRAAGAFQTWYAATRLTPRGPDPVTDAHRTRLWLAEATRVVLANGLHELGLTAPEHS